MSTTTSKTRTAIRKYRFETTKTTGNQNVGQWRNELKLTSMTLEELIHWQTDINTGNPVKPGIKKDSNGPANVANYGEHELLYLDIDNYGSLTWESAIQNEFIKDNAAFIYSTRNHQKSKTTKKGEIPPCDRFRIVFALPNAVYRSEIIEFLNLSFVYLLGHDESCIEVSKVYLGNPGALIHKFNLENQLNMRALFQLLLANKEAFDMTMNRFISKHRNGEFDLDELLAYFDLDSQEIILAQQSIQYYQSVANHLGILRSSEQNSTRKRRKFRNFKRAYPDSHCELMLPENIADSDHGELLVLLSAMANMEGGKSYFHAKINDATREYDKKAKGENYYQKLYLQILNDEYLPFSCRSYCRFSGTCEIAQRNPFANFLHVQPTKQHQVRAIKDYYLSNNFKTIEQIRGELSDLLESLKNMDDGRIHVVQVPCGVGKSFLLKQLSKTMDTFAIATPRHDLFDGFEGAKYSKLASELENLIKQYRNLGINWRKILMAKKEEGSLNKAQQELWTEFCEQENIWNASKRKILTHEKAFRSMDSFLSDHRLIYFDEDPSSKMYPETIVSRLFIGEILSNNKKSMYGDADSEICEFLQELLKKEKGSTVDRPVWKKESLNAFRAFVFHYVNRWRGSGNILDFLNGAKFQVGEYEISSMQIRKIPENKTAIILAAHPNKTLLEQTYGERVVFYDLGKIHPSQGAKLIQYNAKSFSSSSLMHIENANSNLELVKAIREKYRDFAFVYHKSLKKMERFDALIDDSDLWFGAIEGQNSIQSKDLVVVGMKNLPPGYLKLLSACLNLNYNSVTEYNLKSSKTIVRNEYFEFTIMALSPDPTIQKLQMHFMEEALMQAVGRARYYSNDVVVILYANYPLPEFEQFGHDLTLYEDEDE